MVCVYVAVCGEVDPGESGRPGGIPAPRTMLFYWIGSRLDRADRDCSATIRTAHLRSACGDRHRWTVDLRRVSHRSTLARRAGSGHDDAGALSANGGGEFCQRNYTERIRPPRLGRAILRGGRIVVARYRIGAGEPALFCRAATATAPDTRDPIGTPDSRMCRLPEHHPRPARFPGANAARLWRIPGTSHDPAPPLDRPPAVRILLLGVHLRPVCHRDRISAFQRTRTGRPHFRGCALRLYRRKSRDWRHCCRHFVAAFARAPASASARADARPTATGPLVL